MALAGAAIGIGNIFASFLSSFSKNPQLKGELFNYLFWDLLL
jgi:F0F1-type ATP synthase membrane subunit c/vacuolar-type H+-ATPase subunit K